MPPGAPLLEDSKATLKISNTAMMSASTRSPIAQLQDNGRLEHPWNRLPEPARYSYNGRDMRFDDGIWPDLRQPSPPPPATRGPISVRSS